jgi:hypothetical protein
LNKQSSPPSLRNRNLVFGGVLVLALLHQDFWLWSDRSLVFGFLPIGLAYHSLFSILAACLWAAAVKFAWPSDLEELAEGHPLPVPEQAR